jgi:hypothetical protein
VESILILTLKNWAIPSTFVHQRDMPILVSWGENSVPLVDEDLGGSQLVVE